MLRREVFPVLSGGLLFSSLTGLTGCSFSVASETPQPQWTQTEVLVDHSDSVRDQQRLQLENLAKTLRSINGAGETEVLFINENPLAYPPVASIRVEPNDPARVNDEFYLMAVKKDLERSVPDALKKVESALRQTAPARATAIIDSLEAAARSFRAIPKLPARKSLVILSDMIEDSAGIHLLREDLTPKGRQQIIERIKREGRMPDLRDVSVIVAGARSDPKISRRVNDGIERWWQEFFAAAGARLNRNSFTPVLRESLLTIPQ